MLFVFNSSGDILHYTPENVYQGSNNANTIYVLAPLSNANQVYAQFTLPNGRSLYPNYLPNANNDGQLTLLDTVNINQADYSVWSCKIKKVVTAIAGYVDVQFHFINENEEITTAATSFPILKGNAPVLPTELTEKETLEEILEKVSVAFSTLNNKVSYTEIIDHLDSANGRVPLSANQGRVLKEKIIDENEKIEKLRTDVNELLNRNLFEITTDLGEPEKSKMGKIYLLAKSDGSSDKNLYAEYMVVETVADGEYTYVWEKYGDTSLDEILSKIVPDLDLDTESDNPIANRPVARAIEQLHDKIDQIHNATIVQSFDKLPPPSSVYIGKQFLVPKAEDVEDNNKYDEYQVIEQHDSEGMLYYAWEKIGTSNGGGTNIDFQLDTESANPVANSVITQAIQDTDIRVEELKENKVSFTDKASQSKYGVVKTYNSYGVQMYDDAFLATVPASDSDIKTKDSTYKPITPKNMDKALKTSITTNTETLTDEEKASACEWLGALPKQNTQWARFAYTNDESGNIYMMPISSTNMDEYSIVRRSGRQIKTITPVEDGDVPNKKYVDDTVKLYLHDITLKTQVSYDPEFGAEINDVLKIKILSKKSTAFEFDNLLKERNANGAIFNMVSGYFYKEQIAGSTEISAKEYSDFFLMAVEGNKYAIVDEGANPMGIIDPATVSLVDNVEEIQYPLLGN